MTNDLRPTITIKLKPHLQEYLRCKLQEEELLATKRNIIGVMMRPFLEVGRNEKDPINREDPLAITFYLPYFDDLNIRNGTVFISETNQANFERILAAHFKDLFFNYVDDKIRYLRKKHTAKGAIKKSILQFCSDYSISFNALTYDMLKKAYYRRGKNGPKQNIFFSSKMSLICPLLFMI